MGDAAGRAASGGSRDWTRVVEHVTGALRAGAKRSVETQEYCSACSVNVTRYSKCSSVERGGREGVGERVLREGERRLLY